MTAENVQETFGAPESVGNEPPYGVGTFWTYPHEKTDWGMFIFPQVLLSIPILAVWPGRSWDESYVKEIPLVLHFEDEKLVRWQVTEPVPAVSSGYDALAAQEKYQKQVREWQRIKDIKHHKKGHTHHHR